jgi:ADP-ribose pyrophosphatase YjhB (NUDIX family)
MKKYNNSIGVIIGRFQTHQLHDGHIKIIGEVLNRHNRVIVLIGCSPTCGTKENPLDYQTRALMIRDSFEEEIVTAPLQDYRSDIDWSKNVDRIIRTIYPIGRVGIYGSRDSFISHYHGQFETVQLPKETSYTSTELREDVGSTPLASENFRRGVIYLTQNRYPMMYHVVDVAVIKGDSFEDMEVLMGTKYGESELRLIGGFCDKHIKLETTCKKEVSEEANISVEHELHYVGSYAIKDWRYEKCSDKVISSFFWTKYTFGDIKSNDDLDDIKWYKLSGFSEGVNGENGIRVVDSHQQMIKDLIKQLKEESKNG